MPRKQLRTVLKPFDIKAWIEMDEARTAGDLVKATKIRNTLVEQNRPYAVKVACSFQKQFGRSCDLQDLIQCACEGLTRAVEKFNPRASKTYKLEDFDPAKGAFTAYASRYILAELRKWSRRDKILFKPLHEEVPKAFRTLYTDFVAKHKRAPEKGELGDLPTGISLVKIARACEPNPAMISIDAPCRDGRVDDWHDRLPSQGPTPEEELIRREEEFQELLKLTDLPGDEHVAVVGYVIEERSYVEVGSRMTPKRTGWETQVLVKRGLERLRQRMGKR